MINPLKVSCSFKNGGYAQINPCVTGVYNYPFTMPGLSRIISPNEWVVEYHNAYAGKILFLKPGAESSCKREKHMVHLYAPGCTFMEDTRESKLPRQEAHMHFRGGESCGLHRLTGDNQRYCRFLDREGLADEILEKCALLCCQRGEHAFWEVQSLLVRCISLLLNCSKKTSGDIYEISNYDSPVNPLVKEAELYMRQNISSKMTNFDIADYLNLSESTFNHRFKQKTGVSPRAKIFEIKIDVAKGLLFKGKRLNVI